MLLLLVCVPFAGALLLSALTPRSRLPPAGLASLSALLGLILVLSQTTAVYDDGEWNVIFKRDLQALGGISFAPDQFVPIAF